MIYLDSNIFVIGANPNDKRQEKAILLLELVEEGEIDAFTSVITVDEVVYTLSSIVSQKKAEKVWGDMMNEPGLQIKDLDKKKTVSARKYFPELDPRDALHFQTFKSSEAEKLVTEDKDFLNKKDDSVNLEDYLIWFGKDNNKNIDLKRFNQVLDKNI